MTEIAFDTKNDDFIYYLKAGTFENYSPISSARPHDFDIHHYQISTDESKQHTDRKSYLMQSLQVSTEGNGIYFVMFDDANAETADDIFEAHQRIFYLSLDESDDLRVASKEGKNADIYDFTVTPNDEAFIFQAVNGTGEDGIYEYELFTYDRETGTEELLTNMREHTSNPVIGPDGETVYFIVDKQFGRPSSDYYLYKMNMDGSGIEEVSLSME
ncbi:TolB family protein [Oceanobacillus halotolerans]|uniref:TolB family protein n=1 Tax=Oceanobacillus halotolerans TaxID=2663380 RepID=UPI0013D95307|nr:hypothetical protein [Oceanobacillus halotolerans]